MSDASFHSAPRIGPQLPSADRKAGPFGLHRTTALLLLAVVVTTFAGLGLAVRATIERNEIAHRASEAVVASVIDALQRDVVELLVDFSGLVQDPDMAEMLMGSPRRAALIGRWVTRYSEVDIALVADRSGRFLQMAEGGEARPAADVAAARRDLAPFIDPWLATRPQPGQSRAGIVQVAGLPMLAAAIPIRLPTTRSAEGQPADLPGYLIGLRHIERDLTKTLTGEFGFQGTRLVRDPMPSAPHSLPIHLWSGESAGFVIWDADPDHPHTLPWVPLALLIPAGLLAGGLVWRLRKSAEGEKKVLEVKSAEALAAERLIADIRTGIRQLSWNLTEGVVLLEEAGEVRYANAAAARLAGHGAENLLGTSFADACEGRFPALARHLRDYIGADPKHWSGDASWFSTVGTDGRMIKVGIHEFRRSDQHRMIGLLISETVWNQLGDPLDRIGIGVVCLDGEGQLIAANKLAAELCRALKAPLDEAGPDGRMAPRLLDLLQAGRTRTAKGEVASLALARAEAAEPIIATLIPMTEGEDGRAGGGLFVLLRDPSRAMAVDTALLAELFAMTPAECRVAIRTAAGASAEVLAEELGLSPHTVRNHLKSVMRKTSTSKQPETVALLWRLAAYTGGQAAD